MMEALNVSIGSRAYPILIAENLLADSTLWSSLLRGRPFCIVTDALIAPLYLAKLCQTLGADSKEQIIIASGENHKNLQTLTLILTHLTEKYFPREGVLIALGGGVIGDMAGFAAAVYQRGIEFIQVPTTTLAMLDSSVGGKTAVNLGSAKNNIGSFHQPSAVVMDLGVLTSLPEREYAAGLVEAIKHGLIRDEAFFEWICNSQMLLLKRDRACLNELIRRSCRIKADIVEQDEKEQNLRMLLNFGHTFGHAIEAYSDYQDFKHGEAVAIGIMCALRFAEADPLLIQKTQQLFQAFALPVTLPADYSPEKLRGLMQHDKKKRQGKLNLILVKQAGQAFIAQEEVCKIRF